MKKTLSKVLVLALVLCMVLPQTALAATYNYLEVTIAEKADATKTVTATSARYLANGENLAGLLAAAINEKYSDLTLAKTFESQAMQDVMDAGIVAYDDTVANGTTAWETWVTTYYSDVDDGTNGLKDIAKDLTKTIGDLTVGTAYSMEYTNKVAGDAKVGTVYTVTVVRRTHSTGGGSSSSTVKQPDEGETPEQPTTLPFSDVSKDAWYYDAVVFCVENGIMVGIDAETISPDTKLTRSMLMTMLARMDGVDTSASDPWYAMGMDWAVANGVSDGTEGEGNITREQIVTMLYRYAALKGLDVSATADLGGFSDADEVSDWASAAMQWAVAVGVLNGADGAIMPQGEASRAEVAQFIMNFCQLVLGA